MGLETKKERKRERERDRGRQRETEREGRSRAAPGDSGLLSVSNRSGGSLLAKVQAVTLSPNEGARQLLDMLGSH